jgi:hypothetical protein
LTDFLDEIEEQLRSDRYKQLLLRIWPWALGIGLALLLAALAWWGFDSYQKNQTAKASETYSAAMETAQKGDLDRAFTQFGDVSKGPSAGYRALALMQQGGIRLGQGRTPEAVQLFDQAASAAPNPLVGDVARLKSAFALMDTAPYAELETRLKPLTDGKRPYHAVAREALAFAKLKAGRMQDAKADFQILQLLPDATQAARQRAQSAIFAIDSGAAANLPAEVQAAQTLPPPPPPSLSNLIPQTGAAQ